MLEYRIAESYVQRYHMLAHGRTLVDGDTASQASNGWEKLLPSDEERDDLIEGVAILGEN